jgi:hypothetical protein
MVIPWVIAAIAIGDLKISGLDLDILIDTLEKRFLAGQTEVRTLQPEPIKPGLVWIRKYMGNQLVYFTRKRRFEPFNWG